MPKTGIEQEIIEALEHDDGDGPEDVFEPVEIRLGDEE